MTVHTDVATSPLAGARTALAAALESATGYTAHPGYTTSLHTPCYVLQPDGWQWLTGGGYVVYRVTVTCLYGDQSGATSDAAEELARQAAVVCADQNWRIPDVPAPGSVTNPADPGRPLAGVQFTATLQVSLRG
jgi:hypothetical protein